MNKPKKSAGTVNSDAADGDGNGIKKLKNSGCTVSSDAAEGQDKRTVRKCRAVVVCSTFGRVAVKRRMEKEVVTLTSDAAEDEGKRNVKKGRVMNEVQDSLRDSRR